MVVGMSIQNNLEDFDGGYPDEQSSVPVSEQVRNNQFDKIKDTLGDRQWKIFQVILEHHPKGICAWEIRSILKIPLNTFSGRLTEMHNPNLRTKRPYCFPPVIEPLTDPCLHPNTYGEMTKYTKYRVRHI